MHYADVVTDYQHKIRFGEIRPHAVTGEAFKIPVNIRCEQQSDSVDHSDYPRRMLIPGLK